MTEVRHPEDREDEGLRLLFAARSQLRSDASATALEATGGIDVLLDTEDILPTEEWRARLEGLIGQADTIFIL